PSGPSVGDRAGRVRAWLSGLLVLGGGAGLAGGAVLGTLADPALGLLLGVMGGAASFVGIVLAAVFWVPWLVRTTGRWVSRGGPAARLAVANTSRNPRRTAATSAALLIGVTLVAMMSTGAESTRATLAKELDSEYPVDLAVRSGDYPVGELPASILATIAASDDFTASAEVRALTVRPDGDRGEYQDEVQDAVAVDAEDLREVLREVGAAVHLDDSTVLVPAWVAGMWEVQDGDRIGLTSPTPSETGAQVSQDGPSVEVTVRVWNYRDYRVVLTTGTAEELRGELPVVSEVWAQLTDVDQAPRVVEEVDAAAANVTGTTLATEGSAVERAMFKQIIDTLLAVLVGLLGVAVVIAIVGVANTLSLSVIERRRESATLRAIGLSRRQLRGTLAVEGVVIALVGAVVGTALGAAYGWIGVQTVLGQLGTVTFSLPWTHLTGLLVVALAAGLLASVIPGRTAARTPPVQALGVE
ncbi:hypothetical protein N869_03030, partial [Cellulomonas bogoriensis 69B4 = DSM 16987]